MSQFMAMMFQQQHQLIDTLQEQLRRQPTSTIPATVTGATDQEEDIPKEAQFSSAKMELPKLEAPSVADVPSRFSSWLTYIAI